MTVFAFTGKRFHTTSAPWFLLYMLYHLLKQGCPKLNSVVFRSLRPIKHMCLPLCLRTLTHGFLCCTAASAPVPSPNGTGLCMVRIAGLWSKPCSARRGLWVGRVEAEGTSTALNLLRSKISPSTVRLISYFHSPTLPPSYIILPHPQVFENLTHLTFRAKIFLGIYDTW